MNVPVLPADTFIVINRAILTEYDKKLLINLYQPLIGALTTSLYLSFWSYLDKSEIFSLEWSHHHLMSNMHLKLDDIISSREKLEGIGLMKTYYKKGSINSYIYELYAPLSAYEFFNNPILSTSLLSNIGKNEFKKLIDYYSIPSVDLNGYENITCSFKDVFDVVDNPNLEYYDNIRGNNSNKLVLDDNLNLNDILTLIPEGLLSTKIVPKDTKTAILQLAYIYNFNNEEMTDIIINSINEEGKIVVSQLKTNCEKYYKFEHSGSLPMLIYKKQPEYLRNNITDTSKKSKLIYQFENLSPYEYLTSKNGGVRPSVADLNLVAYLLVDLKLLPGVVNVLLDYVLKINDNKLNKPFVEAIASQWLRSNVKTVSEAMSLAEKEHKRRSKNVQSKVSKKRGVDKPNWFDKDINVSEASLEEQEEMDKLLSEFK